MVVGFIIHEVQWSYFNRKSVGKRKCCPLGKLKLKLLNKSRLLPNTTCWQLVESFNLQRDFTVSAVRRYVMHYYEYQYTWVNCWFTWYSLCGLYPILWNCGIRENHEINYTSKFSTLMVAGLAIHGTCSLRVHNDILWCVFRAVNHKLYFIHYLLN